MEESWSSSPGWTKPSPSLLKVRRRLFPSLDLIEARLLDGPCHVRKLWQATDIQSTDCGRSELLYHFNRGIHGVCAGARARLRACALAAHEGGSGLTPLLADLLPSTDAGMAGTNRPSTSVVTGVSQPSRNPAPSARGVPSRSASVLTPRSLTLRRRKLCSVDRLTFVSVLAFPFFSARMRLLGTDLRNLPNVHSEKP